MKLIALRFLLSCVAAQVAAAADFSARWNEIKATATPAELYTVLYALPKGGDLHNHLGGAMLPEQWYRAATDPALKGRANYYVRVNYGAMNLADPEPAYPLESLRESAWRALPAADRTNWIPLEQLSAEQKAVWLSLYQLDKPGEGRYTFFGASPRQRLRHMTEDPVIMLDLLVDSMKLYGAEGVRYLEYQATPFNFRTPDGALIDEDTAAGLYEERLSRPDAKATGVDVRFLITGSRFAPDAEAQVKRIYAFLDRHRERWVGINLAGIEERGQGYPSRFLSTFRELRTRYPDIGISIHAGEMDGPNTHVRDTLLLGATRIGHGVTLIKDPDTLLLMRFRPWLVEVNLISNRLLEYVPDLDQHPFPEYLRLGIPVCLNTDDRGWWHSTMTDEYYEAVTRFHLSWAEIRQIGRASIEHSFLDPVNKARVLQSHETALDNFERKMSAGDWRATLGETKPVAFGYAARYLKLKFP